MIDTTANHWFYIPGADGTGGRWVKAGALKYGTHLRTPDGGDRTTVVSGWIPPQRDGWMWDLTIPGNNDHDFYIDTATTDVLVHNTGGMQGCSDAAYQGVLHLGEEAAKEGPGGVHDLGMTDDQLADYLDNYANTSGSLMNDGATGWYDAERGVMVIQRSEYSMTAYKVSIETFYSKLAG